MNYERYINAESNLESIELSNGESVFTTCHSDFLDFGFIDCDKNPTGLSGNKLTAHDIEQTLKPFKDLLYMFFDEQVNGIPRRLV